MTEPDPDTLSPVYARAARTRPQVEQPSSPWTMVLGVGGAIVLGVFVFSSLSHSRAAHAQVATLKEVSSQPEPSWSKGLLQLAQNTAPQPPPKLAACLRRPLRPPLPPPAHRAPTARPPRAHRHPPPPTATGVHRHCRQAPYQPAYWPRLLA